MSKTRLLAIALIGCISASWAQSPFPLQVPQRPDSFPLPLPQRSTNLVGELLSLGEFQDGPSGEKKSINLYGGSTNAHSVARSMHVGFLVTYSGDVLSWGSTEFVGPAGPPPPVDLPDDIADVVKVCTVGNTGAIALKSNGSLVAWGTMNGDSLTVPADTTDIADVAATSTGVYALKRDGSAVCWGRQPNNVGTGFPPYDLPASLPISSDMVGVAVASTYQLALKRDGTVKASGFVRTIQNINGVEMLSYSYPEPPSDLTNVVAIAAADNFWAALKEDGTVFTYGGITIVDDVPTHLPSTTPPNLPTIAKIKASPEAIFALSVDGRVFSWPPAPDAAFPTQRLVAQINELGGVIDFSVSGFGASAVIARRGAAAEYAVKSLGIPVDSLASLIAERVLAKLPDNYGIATKADLGGAISSATAQAISQVQASPNDYNLFSAAQHQANFDAGVAQGVNTVTSSPNTWSLYTVDQIKNMALGDLMLTKNINGKWVLNYDIEQSPDLVNWTPYAVKAEELTGLPTNKAFIRIRLKK